MKELRLKTGMNMKEFSEYFNFNYRTLQYWESGARKCPPYLLELVEYKLKKEGLI